MLTSFGLLALAGIEAAVVSQFHGDRDTGAIDRVVLVVYFTVWCIMQLHLVWAIPRARRLAAAAEVEETQLTQGSDLAVEGEPRGDPKV